MNASQYAEQPIKFTRIWQWVDNFALWLLSFKPPIRVTVQMAGLEEWTTALIPPVANNWDEALKDWRQGFLISRVTLFVAALPGDNKFCNVSHPSLLREGDAIRVEVIPGSNI